MGVQDFMYESQNYIVVEDMEFHGLHFESGCFFIMIRSTCELYSAVSFDNHDEFAVAKKILAGIIKGNEYDEKSDCPFKEDKAEHFNQFAKDVEKIIYEDKKADAIAQE